MFCLIFFVCIVNGAAMDASSCSQSILPQNLNQSIGSGSNCKTFLTVLRSPELHNTGNASNFSAANIAPSTDVLSPGPLIGVDSISPPISFSTANLVASATNDDSSRSSSRESEEEAVAAAVVVSELQSILDQTPSASPLLNSVEPNLENILKSSPPCTPQANSMSPIFSAPMQISNLLEHPITSQTNLVPKSTVMDFPNLASAPSMAMVNTSGDFPDIKCNAVSSVTSTLVPLDLQFPSTTAPVISDYMNPGNTASLAPSRSNEQKSGSSISTSAIPLQPTLLDVNVSFNNTMSDFMSASNTVTNDGPMGATMNSKQSKLGLPLLVAANGNGVSPLHGPGLGGVVPTIQPSSSPQQSPVIPHTISGGFRTGLLGNGVLGVNQVTSASSAMVDNVITQMSDKELMDYINPNCFGQSPMI